MVFQYFSIPLQARFSFLHGVTSTNAICTYACLDHILAHHDDNETQVDIDNISSPNVRDTTMGSSALDIYSGVCKCVLTMLNSASLTKMLLDSNPDTLTLFIRSLVSLSDCDFSTGELKPCIQFSDLLPLPVSLCKPYVTQTLLMRMLDLYYES